VEYTIVIETHAGQKMVHTIITGDLTEKARDRISAETIQLLNDRGIHKTIWDVREARLKYSLTKIHMAVVNAKTAGLNDENCVALIYRNNQREYEHAKNVTESIKLTNLNYFQSLNQGINWLISRG
jgi:hypothetical protein